MSNAFVNTFIFSSGGDIRHVIVYYIFCYLALTVFSLLQGYIARKIPVVSVCRIGIFSYMILYALILVFKSKVGGYVWLIGTILGLSSALYHITLSAILLKYSNLNPKEQNTYVGVSTTLSTLTSIVVPFITGFAIQILGEAGYYIVFSITLVLVTASFMLTFRLPRVEYAKNNVGITKKLITLSKDKNRMYAMLGEFIRGIKEGSAGFIFYLLLFMASPKEGLVGMFNTVAALVQTIGYYYAGKRLSEKNAVKMQEIQAWVVFLASLVFFVDMNIYNIVFMGLITYFFLSIASSSALYIFSPTIRGHINEGFVMQAVFISSGRVVGLLILLLVSGSVKSIGFTLIILSALQGLSALAFKKVKNEQDPEPLPESCV